MELKWTYFDSHVYDWDLNFSIELLALWYSNFLQGL